MKSQQIWFVNPYEIEIREVDLEPLSGRNVLVKTFYSGISTGTEMLAYKGELPTDIPLDSSISCLQNSSGYPIRYGYASVGKIIDIADQADHHLLNLWVFSFQPHCTHFIASIDELLLIPDGIEPESAIFLANVETAITLVLDGNPLLGEQVVVLGQGVVGWLVNRLLTQFPLSGLHVLDTHELRRKLASDNYLVSVYDPFSEQDLEQLYKQLRLTGHHIDFVNNGADLIFELSGVPQALNTAIQLSGFKSRIVMGSWYGNKSTAIHLGGKAHRNRLEFITSQVSSIAPELSGRWDKTRRFDCAWRIIEKIRPQQIITHRIAFENANSIYRQLANNPADAMQVVLTY